MYENNVVDISRWKIKQIFMFYMQMRRINQQEHSSLTFLNTGYFNENHLASALCSNKIQKHLHWIALNNASL